MKPGLCMVFDPHSKRAQADVAGMLDQLGAVGSKDVVAGAGANWAAAVIAPPAHESTCGADVYSENGDILIWTGDLFLPSAWTKNVKGDTCQRTLSIALQQRLSASGIDVLAEVDGTFCGAWYNRSTDRWTIFNDRLGFLPVFWAEVGDRLIIGPKAWVTWQATNLPLEISDVGVTDLIRTQNMVDDHTLIKGVHWLIGGHAIVRDPIGTSVQSYWELHPHPDDRQTKEDLIDSFVDVWQRTLDRHADCESPLLLGISGGMDSRVILAGCHSIERVPATFTCGFPFSEDVRFGRQLAQVAQTSHTFVPLEEDSLPDRVAELVVNSDGLHGAAHLIFGSSVPAFLANHTGSVLLEGIGNGVGIGSCVPYDSDIDESRPAHQTHWARTKLHDGGDINLINRLLRSEYASASHLRWQIRIDEKYQQAPTDDLFCRAEYVTQSGRSGRNNVIGPMLLRNDVLMRHPYCAPAIVNWLASAPPRIRRGKQIYMEILRRRFAPFARVQRSDFNGLPIAENRWLREYCWQREKLHRFWTRLRYPWVRRWGVGGQGIRTWAFDKWRQTGQLNILLSTDARVLGWVDRASLLDLWQAAVVDSKQSVPLLTLATIEIMVRWLESLQRPTRFDMADRVRFQSLNNAGQLTTQFATLS